MIKNYLKIAWRNIVKNKASSSINIGGLSVGMAVAMLIGFWIWDELSFDKYHQNYSRIASVMENRTVNGEIYTGNAIPLPLGAEMQKTYGSDFKHIVMASWNDTHTLSLGDKNVAFAGSFIGEEAPEMLSLNMLKGNRTGLNTPSSVLLSQTVAKALFGDADPMGKTIKLDNKAFFNVSGVYADLPRNTSFHDVTFMLPWQFYVNNKDWIDRDPANWNDNSLMLYVQIADNADMIKLSEKMKNVVLKHADPGLVKTKPAVFLQPMSKWHLYSEFKNGVNAGGAITNVWLFGTIGLFVLLLACINFMNLSTARSEKRSKEVGIRKAIGSLRGQLISQFFCESLLIAVLAFAFSLVIAALAMPYFNNIAGKQMSILWSSPLFWMMGAGFTLFTGIIAGSYPAFYLSSFQPVKVLKGTFKAGRFAALPRKVLVVIQFAVSVVLIIGTIVVFKQIQFAKNRPVGYTRDGLVDIPLTNDDLHKNFNAFRTDLLASGMVSEVTGSTSSTTGINNNRGDVSWTGKDPAMTTSFANIAITSEYGKTVGWQFTLGRDFERANISDSIAVILNEAAVKYMGLKNPVGKLVQAGKRSLSIIGVVKDMVMASPYEPAKQTLFYLERGGFDDVIVRVNPKVSTHNALEKIAEVSKTYSPSVPFAYRFADDEYAKKFADEERVGKLASTFAVLAIFISCLGLFGMASFMAEQRTKEIGVRKVLGASIFSLWRLMSFDFIILVGISLLIAIPTAYYFMHGWLQDYKYRAELSWWIFTGTAVGAIIITILTVSYQSIKAALMNPVNSLKTE
ncbi:ABC transporter permease [Mucilaginibacter sp.]|uniref:ABC transporter permease n=1 Tax=Mucilaginibacter sp. TaxID=1882438 RepID=UPI002605028C|nr:ABC transporter permease [Mucilaginibacter sp.]MDB4921866.1 ABC-type antimicrobial peptide transport system, permease component [Mucilaginibacter sp.]